MSAWELVGKYLLRFFKEISLRNSSQDCSKDFSKKSFSAGYSYRDSTRIFSRIKGSSRKFLWGFMQRCHLGFQYAFFQWILQISRYFSPPIIPSLRNSSMSSSRNLIRNYSENSSKESIFLGQFRGNLYINSWRNPCGNLSKNVHEFHGGISRSVPGENFARLYERKAEEIFGDIPE